LKIKANSTENLHHNLPLIHLKTGHVAKGFDLHDSKFSDVCLLLKAEGVSEESNQLAIGIHLLKHGSVEDSPSANFS